MRALFVVLALVLVLFGCSGGGGSGSGSGLVMSFEPNDPPNEIRNSNVDIVVKYQNQGYYTIPRVYFYLHGHDPRVLTQLPSPNAKQSEGALEGKSQYRPETRPEYVEWASSISHPPGSQPYPQVFTVTACYQYESLLTPNICVSPESGRDDVATADGESGVQGTGTQDGPVTVTSIKDFIDDEKIELEIGLSHKGSGTVYSRGGVQQCYSINADDEFLVDVDVTMGGTVFNCKPKERDGFVYLGSGGSATIYCEANNPFQAYTCTQLQISIKYNYAQSITKKVTIMRD